MSHRIFPYGPLLQLADNVWQVTGSLAIPVPRNMTVVRTADRALVLYSVIAMNDADMTALEALGEPRVMVVPHRRHQMDAPFYAARYPALRVLAPDPTRVKNVKVDGALHELSACGIDAYVLPGNDHEDVVMEVPFGDGRALCVCESLSNIRLSGVGALLARLVGPPGGSFGVARAVRFREIPGRAELRAWLSSQAKRSDLRALLLGHGEPLVGDISAALNRAATQV